MRIFAICCVLAVVLYVQAATKCATVPFCGYTANVNDPRCNDPSGYITPLSCLKETPPQEKYAVVFSVDQSGSMSLYYREESVKRLITDIATHFRNLYDVDENFYSIYLWTKEGRAYVPDEIIWEQGTDFDTKRKSVMDKFAPGGMTSLDFGIDPALKLFDTLEQEDMCPECRKILVFITDGDGKYTPAGIKDYLGDEEYTDIKSRAEELFRRNIETFSLGVHVGENDVYLVNELAAVSNGASVGSIRLPIDEFTCTYLNDDGETYTRSIYGKERFVSLWEKIMDQITENIGKFITHCSKPCPAGASCFGSQVIPCSKGLYSVAGQDTCSDCPHKIENGKVVSFMYTDEEGSKICRRCPYTYEANSGRTGCTKITSCSGTKRIREPNPYRIDKYLWTGGCDYCPIGHWPEGSLNCRLCPAGTEGFMTPLTNSCQPNSMGGCCSACAAGEWSEPGSSTSDDTYKCKKCEANLFRDTGDRSNRGCLSCTEYDASDPNYWTNGKSGQTSCEKCSESSPYVPNPGADCISCPSQPPTEFSQIWKACYRTDCTAGNYSSNMAECIPCPLDSVAPNDSTEKCTKCPEGLFQNPATAEHPIKNTVCMKRCKPGTILLDERTESGDLICEVCPAGTEQPELDGTECRPCKANYFSATEGTEKCELCKEGLGTNGLPGQTQCRATSYWSGSYNADTEKETNPLLMFALVGGAIIIIGMFVAYFVIKAKKKKARYERAEHVFI